MFVLQAKDLVVSARIAGAVVPAIRRLSFDLEPGKILGLVGKSGAGKSMVGRALAQLLPPGFEITAGSLLFEGENLLEMPPRAPARPARASDRIHPAASDDIAQSGDDDRCAI